MKSFLRRLQLDEVAMENALGTGPHEVRATVSWISGILLCSAVYFALFHFPVSLHDVAHYMTAGVSQIRDHQELLYPYNANAPDGSGPGYARFQDNTIRFDVRTNYPSKLYSTLLGLVFAAAGQERFFLVQCLSLGAFVASNILLYLIGRRYLAGTALAWFLLCVSFMPLMRFALSPSNDLFGYLACLILVWCCVSLRARPFVLGLLAGFLCHFRAQSLAIVLALPFVISALYGRRLFREAMIPLVGGTLLTFAFVSLIYKSTVASGNYNNPLDFYVNHFSATFYRPSEFPLFLRKLIDSVIELFDKSQLFLLAYASLAFVLMRRFPVQRGFAISGIVYCTIPVAIYSLDRLSPPASRYFIVAVPLLTLGLFIAAKAAHAAGTLRSMAILPLTAIVICLSWISSYGVPALGPGTIAAISQRMHFLDFDGVEAALRQNFAEDDLVIVNHSLPTGLSRLRKVILAPTLDEFRHGDNREIDGIIFVYANEPPNDFFKPKDWLVDGSLPDEIDDYAGSRFKRTYLAKSVLPDLVGGTESVAFFGIYRNADATRQKSRDTNGRRTYHCEADRDLTRLRIASPNIDDASAWGTALLKGRAHGGGVIVGPGPSNPNVLSQQFAASAGERLKVVARASRVDGAGAATGRLQVNWVGAENKYLSTSLLLFPLEEEERVHSATFVAPAGTVAGVVYVSPHGDNDVARFTEMRVLGK